MKIVLISDIHANAFYFKALLESIKKEKVDKIICLGDLVGYYNEPNEVINLCRDNNITCIQGNHEEYILETLKYRKDKESIYNIEEHKRILSTENRIFIEQLPKELVIKYKNLSMYCVHALPNNSVKYLYNPNEISDEYIRNHDFYCSGHTHIPYVQYKKGTCLINPGSVGQPRDYTTLPSYVLVDMKSRDVIIKKIEVDVESYIKFLKEEKIHKELIDILIRKKK